MRKINILGEIPREVAVACSGGVDSMAVLNFLRNSDRDIHVINFNHGTEYGGRASRLVSEYCEKNNIPYIIVDINDYIVNEKGASLEALWHNARYSYFNEYKTDTRRKIITSHHLDDQVENWIMTAATGNPVLIPYRNAFAGVIRPFITTRKKALESWCERKGVPFLEDPSNKEVRYTRNLVRHEVVPVMLKVNPGLHKVIAKKINSQYIDSNY